MRIQVTNSTGPDRISLSDNDYLLDPTLHTQQYQKNNTCTTTSNMIIKIVKDFIFQSFYPYKLFTRTV